MKPSGIILPTTFLLAAQSAPGPTIFERIDRPRARQ
jgi:hypothetical protein